MTAVGRSISGRSRELDPIPLTWLEGRQGRLNDFLSVLQLRPVSQRGRWDAMSDTDFSNCDIRNAELLRNVCNRFCPN